MTERESEIDFMDLLKAKDVSPEKLAEALEITPRAVYYWTSGGREPRFTIKQVQALCTLLNCSVHELPRNFARRKGKEKSKN